MECQTVDLFLLGGDLQGSPLIGDSPVGDPPIPKSVGAFGNSIKVKRELRRFGAFFLEEISYMGAPFAPLM